MAVVWCEGGMVNTCRESLQSLSYSLISTQGGPVPHRAQCTKTHSHTDTHTQGAHACAHTQDTHRTLEHLSMVAKQNCLS